VGCVCSYVLEIHLWITKKKKIWALSAKRICIFKILIQSE